MIGQLKQNGDHLRLMDRNGIFLGYYNSKTDMTYDRNGKMVGRGNTVAALLVNV
jgi:hypothetical protein